MATSVTAGVKQITVAVDNPDRDDLGGLRIWMDTSTGFTPGPANLVYDGPDLTVVLTDLSPDVEQFLVLALYSQIDPDDFDLSSEYSATPTAPVVAAEDILAGEIRGSNMFASSFGTNGTTLVGAVLAAATTVNVKSTDDFPASGTAMVFGPTNDRDVFTYTGKTATSFTGCSGVLAQPDGAVVVPQDRQLMVIDGNVNEMRFFADRGDGIYEEIASIGRRAIGTDRYIVFLGGPNYTVGTCLFAENADAHPSIEGYNGTSGEGLVGGSSSGNGVYGTTDTGPTGVYGDNLGTGAGVKGQAYGSGPGVTGKSVSGPSLEALVQSTTLVRAQVYLQPGVSLPSGTSLDGDVTMLAGGRVYVYDGTGQREVLKVEPSTFANVATGSTISLTAPPRRYVNTGAAKAALTFNLPASPVNGQPFEICTDNAITTVAIRDSAGVAGNVVNAPTTLAAGGFCKFEYRTANTTWYRVG